MKAQWRNNAKISAATLGTIIARIAIIVPVVNQDVRCWTRIDPSDKCIPEAVIVVEGSTSMININNSLANGLRKKIPNTVINTNTSSSDRGIKDILDNKITVAAVSRDLKESEKASGLLAEYVAENRIAVVVGKKNPVWRLSLLQLKKIFQGEIKNWSELENGKLKTIKVINRYHESGTYQEFKRLVLDNEDFGQGSNIKNWSRDETTLILRELKDDGISYASFNQIEEQDSVHTLRINNLWPSKRDYPLKRNFYYVYLAKDKSAIEVKRWMDYVNSPEGKQIIQRVMEESK